MPRGRKPRPVELRIIEGNPGRRPLPTPLKVASGPPEPPDHLDAIALEEWHRIIAELQALNMITRPDRAALAGYCTAYGRYVTAERRLRETGAMIIRSNNGSLAQSPWVVISNRSLELMHKYLTEFGMTPASRTRLAAVPVADDKNAFALLG